MGKFTTTKIGEIQKDNDNLFNPDTALTIHISLFGKFVPKKARMRKVKEVQKKIKQKNAIKKNGEL